MKPPIPGEEEEGEEGGGGGGERRRSRWIAPFHPTWPVRLPLPLLVVASASLLDDVIQVGGVPLRAGVRFHVTVQVTWGEFRTLIITR